MHKLALVIFAGLFSIQAKAVTTGFDIGNDLKHVEISGDVFATCTTPPTIPSQPGHSQYYNCTGDLLDPAESARFVLDHDVDADEVKLTAKRADGSTRSQSNDYDHSKHRSDRFNLWIETVFQHGLLDMGKNEVTYELKKSGKVVETGTFTANVTDGGSRTCASGSVMVGGSCDDYYGACEQYFEEQNFCQ